MFDKAINTHCLYNVIMTLSSFDKCLGFRLEIDDFTKIVPSVFGPFKDHYQKLLACIKIVFKRDLERIV